VQRGLADQLRYLQLAAGEVQHGEAEAVAGRIHARQQVVAGGILQRLVGEGAGRDNALHAALDRTLAGGGIADLLADGDRDALPDQPGEVAVGGCGRARRTWEWARPPTGRGLVRVMSSSSAARRASS
jgi:hypothetical protein